MTKEEGIELLNAIIEYVRCLRRGEKYKIFTLLERYRHHFPDECFYSGIIYRKQPKDVQIEFGKLYSCSKENSEALKSINYLNNCRIYESTCNKGFDLNKIILFLIDKFELENITYVKTVLNTTNDEKEVICYIKKKDFRKVKNK